MTSSKEATKKQKNQGLFKCVQLSLFTVLIKSQSFKKLLGRKRRRSHWSVFQVLLLNKTMWTWTWQAPQWKPQSFCRVNGMLRQITTLEAFFMERPSRSPCHPTGHPSMSKGWALARALKNSAILMWLSLTPRWSSVHSSQVWNSPVNTQFERIFVTESLWVLMSLNSQLGTKGE